ncbi:hypothetical protein BFJ69_g7027 [Fusarium oxysporum]|uniref:Uncharacterized protein n=1 Tax=Fusarium oxysporum TaxID=5507 RepID=A0A420N7T7_FUSOX|nr:hypothetical protein BFJ69_g7027 [Fusarium oxysporum]
MWWESKDFKKILPSSPDYKFEIWTPPPNTEIQLPSDTHVSKSTGGTPSYIRVQIGKGGYDLKSINSPKPDIATLFGWNTIPPYAYVSSSASSHIYAVSPFSPSPENVQKAVCIRGVSLTGCSYYSIGSGFLIKPRGRKQRKTGFGGRRLENTSRRRRFGSDSSGNQILPHSDKVG